MRDRAAQGHGPGAAAWERGRDVGGCRGGAGWPETKEKTASMVKFVEKRQWKRKNEGERSNGDGFDNTLWCRELRDLARGDGGRCQNTTVRPKKLAEGFAGNLVFPNFGVRSAAIEVAAYEMDCTFRIHASRATPAYIYTQGSEI